MGEEDTSIPDEIAISPLDNTLEKVPVVFTYQKSGRAVYLSHINVMRIFEQSFQRAQLQVGFTQGYNPKPKMEFVNPLATGVSGTNEVMAVEISGGKELDIENTLDLLNTFSPEGFTFKSMQVIDTDRRVTLSKHLGGSIYTIKDVDDEELLESLTALSKSCSKEINVAKLVIKGSPVFHVIIHGEKNPLKSLFGSERDKFDILSHINMHRENLFIGPYSDPIKDYSTFGLMWQ